MSYILEALKKAERQRRLGQAPDIYAPSLADAVPAGGRAKSQRRRWTFAAALLLAAAALLWFVLWNESPRPVPVAAPAPAASRPTQDIPAPAAPLAQAAPDGALPAPHAAASAESAARKPAEQAHASEKAPAAREKEQRKKAHPRPKPAAKPKKSKPGDAVHAGRAGDTQRAPAAAAAAEDEHLPSQHELPENIRQQIPAMAVNGYIYANNPADRSIVINNRVLHEGEQLMPGLVLEKMKPKEAVMNYKGFRYRLLY